MNETESKAWQIQVLTSLDETIGNATGKGPNHCPVFIGKGAYGDVTLYPSPHHSSDDLAVKSFFLKVRQGLDYTILRELSFYGYLASQEGHPAFPVVKTIGWSQSGVEMVMNYVGKGMSTHLLHELHPADKTQIARQLIEASYFAYHSLGVLQRDIKSANLVWDQGASRLSLVDWGISRFFEEDSRHPHLTPLVQTLPYRAPELLLGARTYDAKIEVWSIGILLLEMWSGRLSVSTKGEIEQLLHYFRFFGTPDETVWPGVSAMPYYSTSFPKWPPLETWEGLSRVQEEFLRKVLVMDPETRPTMEGLRQAYRAMDPYPLVEYPSKEHRDLTMAVDHQNAFREAWEKSKQGHSSYPNLRRSLWVCLSEMEAKQGDPEGTAGYAIFLLDRYFSAGTRAKTTKNQWSYLALAAVWTVSKLGCSPLNEDLEDLVGRGKFFLSCGFLRTIGSKEIVKAEMDLLTGLAFVLPDLSPHGFWSRLATTSVYLRGIYLLDLWEASPDFHLILPSDAAISVQSFLDGASPNLSDPVHRFLDNALCHPMAFKDISTRLRHYPEVSSFLEGRKDHFCKIT